MSLPYQRQIARPALAQTQLQSAATGEVVPVRPGQWQARQISGQCQQHRGQGANVAGVILALQQAKSCRPGKVDHLLETGANDVMVVKPCAGSLDDRERLLPYTAHCVLGIDLEAGVMRVEWDADF